MARSRATSELLIGFAVSLLLHGTLVVGIMRANISAGAVYASFLPEDIITPPPRREDEPVPLGLDDSMAATETWLGFEEFQEQIAAPAPVEQGAFTTNPGPSGPEDSLAAPAVAAAAPQDPTQPSEAQRQPVEVQPELQALLTEPPQGSDPIPPRSADEAQPDAPPPVTEAPPAPTDMPPAPDPAAPQAEPAPAQAVPAAPPAPASGGEPGQPADQESDPASAIDVTMEQLTLGKPLAAQGLQIKPRKPVFTTLMLLMGNPGNPSAELRFRRNGEPVRVKLLESSGDPRIDEAVINCLFKWRAAGRKLAELKEGQTFPVRIKILLR